MCSRLGTTIERAGKSGKFAWDTTTAFQTAAFFSLVSAAFSIVVFGALVYGVFKEKRLYVVPYLIFQATFTCIFFRTTCRIRQKKWKHADSKNYKMEKNGSKFIAGVILDHHRPLALHLHHCDRCRLDDGLIFDLRSWSLISDIYCFRNSEYSHKSQVVSLAEDFWSVDPRVSQEQFNRGEQIIEIR